MSLKRSDERGDYGSISVSEHERLEHQQQIHTDEESRVDAEQGAFPPPMKSMVAAEAFGTFVFTVLGCAANGARLYFSSNDNYAPFVWGAALTIGIYVSAALSGGHLNPAVTLSFALVRPADVRFRKLVPYWTAQVGGAAVAGVADLFLFHTAIGTFERKEKIVRGSDDSLESAAAFANYWSLHNYVDNDVHAAFVEGFGTAVLVFVIMVLTNSKNPIRGIAIPAIVGLTYGCLVAALGPLTGASLNPARDLGPRLVMVLFRWGLVALTDMWPYIIGPMIGGPVGAFCADKILLWV